MRRFSQRSSLVTLSEINITPLLDLAFVLLIIFVITTPLLEQGLEMKLPKGGVPDKPLDPRDVRTVEVSVKGEYFVNRGKVAIPLPVLETQLVKDFQLNQNLVVYIRADQNGPWKHVAALIDTCQKHGIRMSARTEPIR